MPHYVYMLASRPRGTLYIGVTRDLIRRVWEHRRGAAPSFTRQMESTALFEVFDEVTGAVQPSARRP